VRRWGHATRTARDAPAALRAAAVQRPDVVVLNFDLPGLNGCRAARQLRRDMANKACLLIAVTAWADGSRRQHGIEAGIDLLLVRPVPPAILETLLLLECVHVNRPRPASGSETFLRLIRRQ
jgi:DNA-binding response OmpR family regulator